jgi:hypothetical protein
MNVSLSIPESALPAWQRRLAQYNAGSGVEPLTLEQFIQLQHDEETLRLEAELQDALRAQMRTVADEIIAAAGGDVEKLQTAILAGKQAALDSLTQ